MTTPNYTITTKYHGPAGIMGARIIARNILGAVVVPYDHALSAVQNHRFAAERLASRKAMYGTGLVTSYGIKPGTHTHVLTPYGVDGGR